MRRLVCSLVLLAIMVSVCPIEGLQAFERHRCCDSEEASCPLLSAAMPCCTGQPADIAPSATPATAAHSKTLVTSSSGSPVDLTTAPAFAASAALSAPHGLHALPPLLKACLRRI